MTEPKIIIEEWEGRHNRSDYVTRLEQEGAYKDLSTVCIVPTRGQIAARVVQNWMGMMTPMNQKFARLFMIGMEVGKAYSECVDMLVKHEAFSTWKYVLTLEEDNMIPPDGLLKLLSHIGEYDALGGLYWTKGEAGQPMCYGNPNVFPVNFIPQIPQPGAINPCNGLGMGFTLFKMDFLKAMREKVEGELFQTRQIWEPGKGAESFTQDLYFFQKAREFGFKFACDASVLVGHYDLQSDQIW